MPSLLITDRKLDFSGGDRFSDINATGKIGFFVEQANDLELHHVRVTASKGSAFEFDSVSRLVLDDIATDGAAAKLFRLTNTSGVRQSGDISECCGRRAEK